MSRRYWKLVKVDGEKLWSSNATGELLVEYEVGKWARAPIGGLLVFKKASYAQKFDQKRNFKIFECEVLGKVLLPARRAISFDLLKALRFWEKPFLRVAGDTWPEGSAAFRLVKLLAPVPPKEKIQIQVET